MTEGDAHTSVPGWPKCPVCKLTSTRDGNVCTTCAANARVNIDSHAYLPAHGPAGVAPAWRPCDYAGCGETWWRHKLYAPGSVGELEGSAPSNGHRAAAPGPRRNGRPTSDAAADTVAPKLSNQRVLVLDALMGAGDTGATDDELAKATGLPLNSVRPRRGELVDAGLVIDSGDVRPSEQGNDAAVWLITIEGIRAHLAVAAHAAEEHVVGP